MSQHNEKEVERAFTEAPGVIREAVASRETAEAVRKIAEKYRLHIDQMGYLAGEIGLVMLGLEPSAQFVRNIEQRLNINNLIAENIARDVSDEIFLKIRESLKEMGANLGVVTPPPPPADIFAQKLSGEVNWKPAEHTLMINPDTPSVSANAPDPYREPIK